MSHIITMSNKGFNPKRKENNMIIIDAGHGGTDPGAIANGITEKDYNLEISLYIYNRLRQLGIPASLTRNSDETLIPSDRINRIKQLGDVSGNILISNHLNAATNPSADGAEVIYALRNDSTLPNFILEELHNEGQNIRGAYQRRLPTDSSKDYYFLMRETKNLEPIIIEYGFVTSNNDDPYQIRNNWRNFAEAVVKAIAQYIDVPYSEVEQEDVNTYTIQAGDTIYGIARRYNVEPRTLLEINNLNQNTILKIGQTIIIPNANQMNNQIPDKAPQNNDSVYIVQSGDSLYAIGRKFNITPDEIMKLNNLNTTLLHVGQQLKIKNDTEENFTTYTVTQGDTLYKLAVDNNTSVNKIKKINNLYNDMLVIGQQLLIPKEINTNDTLTTDNNELIDDSTYLVQSGDSLYSIASKYNVTVDELKKENNLSSNLIHLNQKLIIPSPSIYESHTVSRGESLYSIAQQYNVSIDYLKDLNNLTSEVLSIGQTLKI